MRTRPLGAGGLRVSELALGAAPLGNLYAPVSDVEAEATVRAAWDAGIRCFDTAPHYGLGLSEVRLGAALRAYPRDEYVLCTKVGRLLEPNPTPTGSDMAAGFAVPDDLVRRRDYSAEGVRRSLQDSLRRLGCDHVDVVYVHDPEDHLEQAATEAIPALVALRREGLVRAIGAGMNLAEPLRALVARLPLDVVLVAGRYTLLDRTAAALLDDCAARGVSVVAAAPFNSGLLAGGPATFDYDPAPNDVLAAARACADACERHGVALATAALRFPLRHPAVACSLAGMRSAHEARADAAAVAAPVPDALWDELPDAVRA